MPRRRSAPWLVFVTLAVLLLPFMIRASFAFGTTWDERDRHHYGQMVLEFLQGARDRSYFLVDDGGQYYGGLFDTLSAAAERVIPINRYVLRHILISIFGWVGVVYCGRLAGRLFGPWAGVLGSVLLVTSPRYFADSMNNPKDLPFAAATIAALYYISTISPKWPYLSRATAVKIAIALAVALNIRAAALLYVGYFGLVVLSYMIAEGRSKDLPYDRPNLEWPRLVDTGIRVLFVLIAVALLGTVFWPWAQAAPFTRPIEALFAFSNYPWSGTHVLFRGYDYNPARLPWSYVPWWVLISTPPVVLLGMALSTIPDSRERSVVNYALWAIASLPVVLVIARQSTLYNGIRHLLFIYPIFVVLAAGSWARWLSADRRWIRGAAIALLAVGLVDVIAFDVRSHPNETVYFNQIAGGPKGAFAKYEMDYWGNCVLQAIDWTAQVASRTGAPVAISGDLLPELIGTDAERFHEVFVTPPAKSALFVQLLRGTPEDMKEFATRPDALHRVQMPDGTVLCVVLPGPEYAQVMKPVAALSPPR